MNLALKYRPQTFSEVVGQKVISAVLNAKIQRGLLDQALLFYGPSGVGKTSMARIVAAALNPDSAEDVHNRVHPFVWEIDAASNGSVAAIRDLREKVRYAAPAHRVIILDEAHAISPEGFDALLLVLENPPPDVTFILCTTEIQSIKNTIKHRCDGYSFKLASVDEILDRLKYVNSAEGYEVSEEVLNLIALGSEGSYRESLMLLGQVTVAGVKTLDQYKRLMGDYDFAPELFIACTQGPESAAEHISTVLRQHNTDEIINKTQDLIKDLLILRSGNVLQHFGEALEIRKTLAAKFDTFTLVKAIKILWDLETKMSNAEPVRNLEMAFVLIGDLFKPAHPQNAVSSPAEKLGKASVAMNFNQMQSYQG